MRIENQRVFTDELDAWQATMESKGEVVAPTASREAEVYRLARQDNNQITNGGLVIHWENNKIAYLALVVRNDFNNSVLIEVIDEPGQWALDEYKARKVREVKERQASRDSFPDLSDEELRKLADDIMDGSMS